MGLDPMGATGRKSLAHRSPSALPARAAALQLSRTLRRPLLFCAGIIATGVALKVVGMNLIMDFIIARTQRQEERDQAALQRWATNWTRELEADASAAAATDTGALQ